MPTPARCRAKIIVRAAIWSFLGLAAPFMIQPGPAAAEPPPPSAAPVADTVFVVMENRSVLTVARAEYAPPGFLRLTDHGGKTTYVPIHRVRQIVSGSGEDVTDRVIEGRGGVGPDRPAGKRPPAPPLRRRSSFALTEIGYLMPVNGFDISNADREASLILDYGWMKNRRQGDGLGWTIHADVASYRARLGPTLRYRHWWNDDLALDGELGVLPVGAEDDRDFEFHGPAFVAQADLVMMGDLDITAQAETRAVRYTGPAYLDAGRSGRHAVDVRVGGKVGGFGGIVATTLLSAGTLVVLAMISSLRW
ncbi:MAG: hypothetical protein ACM3JJ_05840 [Hyphomicrobiales bacterium]